jgi:UDP-3-O-[3-hydroxymyristoyl] glucosamine N-acyltransferase
LAPSFTVARVAEALGGSVEGEAGLALTGVRGLADAGPEHLSFLANRRYARAARESRAGAIIVGPKEQLGGRTLIRCADPYAGFAKALRLFHPDPVLAPGVDPRAHVAPDAVVDGARIEAFAWVGPRARVGAGSWVEAGAVVGEGAVVGRDCRLMANSTVCAGSVVGDRVWLNPGAVIGSEGFGFAPTPDGNVKIPQVGRAIVEDDVEVGANSCVDRASLGDTYVRRGAKLDNLVQIGHAADIGADSLLVAFSGVAGSSRLGRRTVLAAKSGVLGHLTVGDDVTVGVASIVHDDLPSGARVSGLPAIEHRRWLRAITAFADLPELMKRMRTMDKDEKDGTPATLPTGAGGLDIQQIMELLPHRYPFLMIDRVLEVDPGKRAVAIKCVSVNEPFFEGHFPGMPIVPGVLIAEAFAQVSGIIALTAHAQHAGKVVYLMGLDRLRFRKPITPGDTVRFTVEKTYDKRGVWKFQCLAEVDGTKVADGEVMATMADKGDRF